LLSEPKWGHLKDLHAAIKLCEPALVAADSAQYIKLGPKQEVCVVFSLVFHMNSFRLLFPWIDMVIPFLSEINK
jgi:hypothetical protein